MHFGVYVVICSSKTSFSHNCLNKGRISQLEPSAPLGDHGAVLRGHEQRPLLNSSSVILPDPIDEQGATSVESPYKGTTNHERLRTTELGPS